MFFQHKIISQCLIVFHTTRHISFKQYNNKKCHLMSKATNEALQQVKLLMTIPENSICADCQKKVAKWASSTLGVFICIDCSGIHRSLGTHISFVRSCTLDSWTPEQARLMRRVGNKVANEYWEAHLPIDFMRPSPSDRFGMENFIRAKYVEKRWAASGDPPHLRKQVRSSGSGSRVGGNMYEGYFTHNPVPQQQQQHFTVPKGHQFEKKDGAKNQSTQAGMKLEDFMNQLNNNSTDEQQVNVENQEEEIHESSNFSFMNKDNENEEENENDGKDNESSFSFIVDNKSKSVTPQPPQTENNVKNEQPVIPKISTAMEIMNGKKTSKKQSLFNKPKGVNRFIKKPTDGNSPEPHMINFDVKRPPTPQQQTQPTFSQPTQYNYSQPTQYNYNQSSSQHYQNPFDNQHQQNPFENKPNEQKPVQKSSSIHHFNIPNPFSHQQ